MLFGILIISLALFQSNLVTGLVSEIAIAGAFLAASVYSKKDTRYYRHSPILYAFFVFAVVVVLRTASVAGIALAAGGSASSISSQAEIAVSVFLATVVPIIFLTRAAGQSMSSIYLKRGNLRLGVGIGIASLVVLFFGIIVGFQLLYANQHGIPFSKVLAVSPLVLIAATLNAPNEELWFRGLFLKKYEPVFGRKASNLLQAPVFMLAHVEAQYSQFGDAFLISFLALVFVAGLAFGYFMQRTDSLIGPTLAHMGADIGIFLPLLLTLAS